MLTRFRMCVGAAVAALAMQLLPGVAAAQVTNGPYIGASLGYGWLELASQRIDIGPICPFGCDGSMISGVTGTVFIGYNRPIGHGLFIGGEADLTIGRFSGTFHTDEYESKLSGTVRGRLGTQVTTTTVAYLTAGFGWLDLSITPSGLTTSSKTLAGYVVGAGVEMATFKHASLRLEYLYGNYGSWGFDASPTVRESVSPDMHQVRIGLVVPLQ